MLFRYKPEIFTDIPGIKHYFPQAVPLVLKLCRIAGVAGAVNRMAHWNESNSKISPGLVIESLVTCVMCNRKPLWRVQEFWAGQDLALMFPGVELSSKQLMIGARVQQDGLPVMGQILAGNTSDKRWNPDVALEMKKLFEGQGFKDIIFVSDCATVSTTALENLAAEGV